MSTFHHARLTAEGTLGAGSGNEIWSCSLKVGVYAAGSPSQLLHPSQSDLDEMALSGAALWGAYIRGQSGGEPFFDTVVRLGSVKASGVNGDDGRNDSQTNPAIAAPAIESRGGKTSPRSNYQNSAVMTLRGATYVRGSGALGRVYVPCPNFNATNTNVSGYGLVDGLMAEPTVGSLVTGFAALITALNNATPLTSGLERKIVNIGQSEDQAGVRWQPVTKVTMDNRPDSVRRRYSALSGRAIQTVTV